MTQERITTLSIELNSKQALAIVKRLVPLQQEAKTDLSRFSPEELEEVQAIDQVLRSIMYKVETPGDVVRRIFST